MSHFARLLRRTREKSGITLSELSRKCKTARQTLSNYERGASLPQRSLLPRIAKWYSIPLDRLEGAYISSAPQVLTGAFQDERYRAALDTLSEGDHFVTITQRSLITEDRQVASFIANLVARGVFFSFVAYLPSARKPVENPLNDPWRSNHIEAGRLLAQELQFINIDLATPNMSYVLIGAPTANDFAYLCATGALIVAVRTEESPHEPLQGWRQLKSVDGERAWVPCDEGLAGELRHWLAFECGIPLPRSGSRTVRRDARARRLRHLSLQVLLDM